MPKHEGEEIPETPEQIRWNRVSTLYEGVKVFTGGWIKPQDNRMSFVSTKESPLTVIFYNCPDAELTGEIIRAARTRNDYWNSLTPASLAIGAFSLIYIAASFLDRPLFLPAIAASLTALFIPLLPIIPPGLLLTIPYRRMMWQSQKLRTYRDLARLPMRYLRQDQNSGILNTGEMYCYVKVNSLPPAAQGEIPLLVPDVSFNSEDKKQQWYFFGVVEAGAGAADLKAHNGSSTQYENDSLPKRSKDPFVSFGVLPKDPVSLARSYAVRAYTTLVLALFFMLSGIGINIAFIVLILTQFGVFS
ncbi:MAG: hypothetical protein LBQ89_02065 [Treponema sp.]|jgi:hypothetical protein|nr:hypothetical protein [Treponema sp.]